MLSFRDTDLPGVLAVETQPAVDERGSFIRTYCEREFADHGIEFVPVQCSESHNRRAGTLRGLHLQAPPYEEAKLVRCTRGAAYDVAVDLRPDSPAYGRWTALELSERNHLALFIPAGFGHGFQTLEDDTAMQYLISTAYEPESRRGVRWDDPTIGIDWPATPLRIVSERDSALPFLPR